MKKTSLFKSGQSKKSSEKTAPTITKLLPRINKAGVSTAAFAGTIILGIGIFLWWQFIFTDAERVFDGMIHETLSSRSVTRVISQEAEAQSLEQINRLQFGGEASVIGRTTINQTGATTATVVTEEIGTPDRDYVRYLAIETSERANDGEQLNFEDIIGVWGVSDVLPGQSSQGEAFGEATLGIIPFGNVGTQQRRELTEFVKENQVYIVDYLGFTKTSEEGRPVYIFPVQLQPEPYVEYLKRYAAAMGIDQLQNVNPADFRGVAPIAFTVRVDMISRQPIEIIYTGQANRSETLRNYGVIQPVELPTETIPVSELQQRIQSVQ